jgi:predicted deacylase
MQVDLLPLRHTASGTTRTLRVLRFGRVGSRPKAYIQAALHADELPGVLVAHELAAMLSTAEATGELLGEVVLVPAANPIGLSQEFLGVHHGRFAHADGQNFNRGFADLSAGLESAFVQRSSQHVEPADDLSEALRHFLRDAAGQHTGATESSALKAQLLALAVDANVVLDLHCDGEAVMHLYTLPSLVDRVAPLARLLGAHLCLTASESGENPFDEACSRPWQVAQATFPASTLATPCLAATVELRGELDVSASLARRDASAIFEFLRIEGLLAGVSAALPDHPCQVLPLAGTEPLVAPAPGVLLFTHALGAAVAAGDEIAILLDPVTGQKTSVTATTTGLLFARSAARWASAGKRIGKIAGHQVIRSGKLLSP